MRCRSFGLYADWSDSHRSKVSALGLRGKESSNRPCSNGLQDRGDHRIRGTEGIEPTPPREPTSIRLVEDREIGRVAERVCDLSQGIPAIGEFSGERHRQLGAKKGAPRGAPSCRPVGGSEWVGNLILPCEARRGHDPDDLLRMP
jgi:hypothetical protein